MKQDAYIYIDCFTSQQRQGVIDAIEITMDGTKELDDTIFDDLLETIEQIIIKELFKPFFKSDYFAILKEKTGLTAAFEQKANVK